MSETQSNEFICDFKTKDDLYAAYMPFIKNGGLFVRSTDNLTMGQATTLKVTLMDELENFIVDGVIVWQTPIGAQGGKMPGFGVRFKGDEGLRLQNKIETHLAGMLQQDRETDTM